MKTHSARRLTRLVLWPAFVIFLVAWATSLNLGAFLPQGVDFPAFAVVLLVGGTLGSLILGCAGLLLAALRPERRLLSAGLALGALIGAWLLRQAWTIEPPNTVTGTVQQAPLLAAVLLLAVGVYAVAVLWILRAAAVHDDAPHI